MKQVKNKSSEKKKTSEEQKEPVKRELKINLDKKFDVSLEAKRPERSIDRQSPESVDKDFSVELELMKFNPEMNLTSHMEKIKKDQRQFEMEIEQKARDKKANVKREYNLSRISKRAYESKLREINDWEKDSKKIIKHQHNKVYGLF